jgi:hypothetical protein
MGEIPPAVWERWRLSEYVPLRQAILVLGGSLRTEAALARFADVSLLYQEGDGIKSLSGVFYLTTKRFLFLPLDAFPHPKFVESTVDALGSLVGVRNDLTILITSKVGGFVNFQFPSTKSLFRCFRLLRAVSEAMRKDEPVFQKVISELTSQASDSETPFSSIEVELLDCPRCYDVLDSSAADPTRIAPAIARSVPAIDILEPVRYVFDYCNHLRFDVHIKLRALFIISMVSFALKFIPFLPLFALSLSIGLLYSGWISLEGQQPQRASENPKMRKIDVYFGDWFQWRDPPKTLMLLKASTAVFVAWALLPMRIYVAVCIVAFALVIVRPVYRKDHWKALIDGFWFCT